jgi:(S)-1-phenylethanol dehydrogenase
MAKSHHDKIAVISGAANGIGQAFAQRLAQDGAHIVVADLAPGTETVKMVEAAGRQALAHKTDVSSEESVKALAAEVAKRFGRCDILVNCAGIYPLQPFAQMTFADWRRVQAINLDSVFLMSAAFAPGMRERKWGRIVNLASSTLGSVVSGFVHYMASKAGIVGITRALASELGPDGITVNAILPGATFTEIPRATVSPEQKQRIVAMQCIPRPQTPEDLIGTILFLASDASAFLTGQAITVDGGATHP